MVCAEKRQNHKSIKMNTEMGEEITDRLEPENMVKNDWITKEDFDDFWAHCIDFMDWHEKCVEREPGETLTFINRVMCVAYCAATWEKWKEGCDYRRSRSWYKNDLDELERKVAALKKERAQLKAKIRKAEKKVKNAKNGGKS